MRENNGKVMCDKCGSRLATNHICYGGTRESANLCDNCLQDEDSILGKLVASFADEAKNAKCCYCGGYPCSGGPDVISQTTSGLSQNRWRCLSCSFEYSQFMLKALEAVSEDSTRDDQIQRIEEIGAAADAHMMAFVRRRDN